MRMTGIVKRILLEKLRDKRTLAMLFIAPLFILTLMHAAFDNSTKKPAIGTVNIEPSIVDRLEDSEMTVTDYRNKPSDLKSFMEDHQLDGIVIKTKDKVTIKLLNDDPAIANKIKLLVNQIYQQKTQSTLIDDMKAQLKDLTQVLNKIPFSPTKNMTVNKPEQTTVKTDYIYGSKDTSAFDTLSPVLIGFFVFFFVFLIAGIGFLKERTTGTLERMLLSPVKRYEVTLSYVISYGLLASIQTLVIVLFAVFVLGIAAPKTILQVIVVNLFVALVALSLGLLLSAFAKSEFQMIQFIPLVIVPQAFLSGLFPLENMAGWLQVLARIMPLYYAGDALKKIMYKEWPLSAVTLDIIVLAVFALLFIGLNVAALKKYRRI
ncbi:ABC transporter permease subunit [Macrococcus equipercicus]|uniref:ABC transporter permease subunit n=1 Tax=Macrococcus equipercicus TaxID=69967 RepID=A0ABQ6R6W3_9STAP|nr:ABC transporter permease [Macrococcus equipercicus]KAA1037610.1 ABC transporter permease subunit [Macrococcus equipercicus]